MALTVHFEVLNQLGTPMMHSATLANRPAAGIAGRIFFRTDSPFGIFRDTGSAWDQISGASTFSGSLAAGQVAFGSAANTIAGTNKFFWDNVNERLGIGTNTLSNSLTISTNLANADIIKLRNTLINQYSSVGFFNYLDAQIGGFGYANPSVLNSLADKVYFYSINKDLVFSTNASFGIKQTIFQSTGNLQIGTPAADTGQRLQVIGDTFLKGSGTTGSTFGLRVQNNSSNNIFSVRNDGAVFVEAVLGNAVLYMSDVGNTRFEKGTSSGITCLGPSTNDHTFSLTSFDSNNYRDGALSSLNLEGNYVPVNGSTAFSYILLNGTVNQTGTNTSISRGFYINPTITSAPSWRSIEWTNNTGFGLYGAGTAANYLGGSLGIKTTAIYSPSTFSLDVNGGLLIKNTAGTTAQLTIINADPSLGGNNGFLVNTVGGTSGSSYVDLQGYYGTSITGSTAIRLNPAGGPVIINSTTNSGEQFQLTGTLRINGQQSATSGGNSGQHLIINLDGTTYKIKLELP